jgi:tetraacyldisaccharide 4'-kinase
VAARERSIAHDIPERLPCPVVSVGNLTVGGSGKTPFVILAAGMAREGGWRPGILSRGYRGRRRHDPLIVSGAEEPIASWRQAGDEPVLMAHSVPGAAVAVGKKRLEAGRLLLERGLADLLILDDGFQHRGLHRDLDIVLVRADNPFGNGRLLPAGPLREPLRALARADAIVITACPDPESPLVADLERRVREAAAWEVPFLHARTEAAGLLDPRAGESRPPESLQNHRVYAFCGLADPVPYRRTLMRHRAMLAGFRAFGDHHRYSPRDVRAIYREAEDRGADLVVTTEKDAIRLEGMELPGEPPLLVLAVRTVLWDPDRLRKILAGLRGT